MAMQELDKFNIDIFRLSNSTHDYQFEIGNSFFEAQPGSLISEGKGEVKVVLDKSDNFIQAGFELDLDKKRRKPDLQVRRGGNGN